MKETKLTRVQILLALSAVLVLIALLLSVVSSGKAYSLAHLNQVIYGCAAAVVLDLIIVFFYKKKSMFKRCPVFLQLTILFPVNKHHILFSQIINVANI